MCWRANRPILAAQIEKMRTDDEELGSPGGIIWTKGHQYWYLEHPNWLISAWAAARVQLVQVTEDCKFVQSTIWDAANFLGKTKRNVTDAARCVYADPASSRATR